MNWSINLEVFAFQSIYFSSNHEQLQYKRLWLLNYCVCNECSSHTLSATNNNSLESYFLYSVNWIYPPICLTKIKRLTLFVLYNIYWLYLNSLIQFGFNASAFTSKSNSKILSEGVFYFILHLNYKFKAKSFNSICLSWSSSFLGQFKNPYFLVEVYTQVEAFLCLLSAKIVSDNCSSKWTTTAITFNV